MEQIEQIEQMEQMEQMEQIEQMEQMEKRGPAGVDEAPEPNYWKIGPKIHLGPFLGPCWGGFPVWVWVVSYKNMSKKRGPAGVGEPPEAQNWKLGSENGQFWRYFGFFGPEMAKVGSENIQNGFSTPRNP